MNTLTVPSSSKVLLGCLFTVSGLIFFIKVQAYRTLLEQGNDIKFHDIQVPMLQLIPRSTIYYPWVIATAIFAEISTISFIISGLVLYTCSKYIENFWDWKQVVKFVLICGSLTNLMTVLVTILTNIGRGDATAMDIPLGGGISYYFGFLVVLKQLIPEHNIVLFQGMINFRVKHLCFVALIVVGLWSTLISNSLYPGLPSINSFFISYIYLRFYQSFSSDPLLPLTTANGDSTNTTIITGDASDTFKLVEFFPTFTKPFLGMVFDAIYEASVFLGIVKPFNDDIIEQSNLRAQHRQNISNEASKSIASSVAERRRQVALQVIEERINQETK